MAGGPIDYLELTRDGMRSVIVRAIKHTAEHGLFGDQHIYLTFVTAHPGVVMPDWLRAQFPDDITIVLQHDFRDLAVMADRFSVELTFGGRAATLVVPFAACKTLSDPSVNYRIDIPLSDHDFGVNLEDGEDSDAAGADDSAARSDGDAEQGTVVSLDAFRKK